MQKNKKANKSSRKFRKQRLGLNSEEQQFLQKMGITCFDGVIERELEIRVRSHGVIPHDLTIQSLGIPVNPEALIRQITPLYHAGMQFCRETIQEWSETAIALSTTPTNLSERVLSAATFFAPASVLTLKDPARIVNQYLGISSLR
jgi:hypothetical protein